MKLQFDLEALLREKALREKELKGKYSKAVAAMARFAKIAPKYAYQIIRTRNTSPATAAKIARFFGKEVEMVIEGDIAVLVLSENGERAAAG